MTGHIYVSLVSHQLLPNLIPALMDRPSRSYLVSSDAMQQNGKAERLAELHRRADIPVEIRPGLPDSGLKRITEFALKLVIELTDKHPRETIVFNATGGNKLMSLGFVETLRDLISAEQLRIVYTDTDHYCIETLLPPGEETRAMDQVLRIPDYLAAYGATCRAAASDSDEWRERINARKSVTKFLANNAKTLGPMFGVMNAIVRDALDEKGKVLEQPQQRFDARSREWKEARQKLEQAGVWARHEGDTVVLHDVDAARFIGGGWLEEYVWHVAHDEHPVDVRSSVEITWDQPDRGNASRNEFDLVAVHSNRMMIVECKTGMFGRDEGTDSNISYKLDSLGRNAGGLFASLVLISARPMDERSRARFSTRGIEIVEPGQINTFRQIVRDWMAVSGCAPAGSDDY